jgi:membrane dipeptidase
MTTAPAKLAAAVCAILVLSAGQLVLVNGSVPVGREFRAIQPRTQTQDPRKRATARLANNDDAALRARAEKLHRSSLVIDTHNDITSALLDDGFDLGASGFDKDGKLRTHTDLKRMKEGGLSAEFFAVYVGREFVNKKPSEGGGAARRALDVIDIVLEQVRRHPETLEMASTVADIRRIAKKRKIAALMGIEGGHAIENSLRTLRMFYKLGIRYMTLTHSNTNDWADSSGDINDSTVKHHNGLNDLGREVVREMNRIGMMVDVSHVSDKTFFDVVEVSRAPVIASHSSCRALANHPRNMTDEMLKATARNGGVVMINFYDGFLDPRKVELAARTRAAREDFAKQFPDDTKRVQEEVEKFRKANDLGKTPLSILIDHIDHIAKVAGIDHVGIGSDFDGVPLTGLPEGMEDISKLPNITYELMKRGYSDVNIKKVLGENFLRVMSRVERVASEMQSIVNAPPVKK